MRIDRSIKEPIGSNSEIKKGLPGMAQNPFRDPQHWWLFRSGKNLTIGAIILGSFAILAFTLVIIIEVFVRDKPFSSDYIINYIGSLASDLTAEVVFFTIFAWGVVVINRRRPLFQLVREHEDFNCPEKVRSRFQNTIERLSAYNEKMIINVFLRGTETLEDEKNYVVADVIIMCSVRNMFQSVDYDGFKKAGHDPMGVGSKERCEIISLVVGNTMESVQREPRQAPEVEVSEGKIEARIPLQIPGNASLWSFTEYHYRFPLFDRERGFERNEEHSFSADRLTEKMEFGVTNTSTDKNFNIIVQSSRQDLGRDVMLAPGAKFNEPLVVYDVDIYDTGVIKFYVEEA